MEHPVTVKYVMRYGVYLRKKGKLGEARECYKKSEVLAAKLGLF